MEVADAAAMKAGRVAADRAIRDRHRAIIRDAAALRSLSKSSWLSKACLVANSRSRALIWS
jgi:hypothetical protein